MTKLKVDLKIVKLILFRKASFKWSPSSFDYFVRKEGNMVSLDKLADIMYRCSYAFADNGLKESDIAYLFYHGKKLEQEAREMNDIPDWADLNPSSDLAKEYYQDVDGIMECTPHAIIDRGI